MINLATNENPLGPAPSVREAFRALADGLGRYPDRPDRRLERAIAEAVDPRLESDQVVVAASGSDVLELMAREYLGVGDEVIISSPTFPVYQSTARGQGASVVDVPLDPATLEVRVDAVLAAVTPRTRVVYVTNPGNPTGVVTPAGEVARLLENLPPDVLLVADEVYHDFVEHPAYPKTIEDVFADRPVLIVHSMSKVHGLANLRLGYGIAPSSIIRRLDGRRRVYHMPGIATTVGIAAMSATDHVDASVALVRRERVKIYDGLRAIGVEFLESHANFVLLKMSADSAPRIVSRLAEEGIAVRGTAGNGYPSGIRVSIGLPEENDQFLEALARIVEGG